MRSRAQLMPAEVERATAVPTHNEAAYQLYLQANAHFNRALVQYEPREAFGWSGSRQTSRSWDTSRAPGGRSSERQARRLRLPRLFFVYPLTIARAPMAFLDPPLLLTATRPPRPRRRTFRRGAGRTPARRRHVHASNT